MKDIALAESHYGDAEYVKSSFSLNNIGETLAFTDPEKNILVEFTYTSDMGGNGDGTPLYVSGSSSTSSSGGSAVSNKESESIKKSFDPYYEAYITLPEIITVQSDFRLKAGVIHHKGENKDVHKKNGYYYLNFGDGYAQSFSERIDMNYQFRSPGTYHMSLEYYSSELKEDRGEPDASVSRVVEVLDPGIEIVSFNRSKGVKIKNNSQKDIDLSHWSLLTYKDSYVLPKNSILAAGGTLMIPFYHLDFLSSSTEDSLVLVNNSYTVVSQFEKRPWRSKGNISSGVGDTTKASSHEETSIHQELVLGEQVELEGDFFDFELAEKPRIQFKEDDLRASDALANREANNINPLWFMMSGVFVLFCLKLFISRPEKTSSELEYDIELIE